MKDGKLKVTIPLDIFKIIKSEIMSLQLPVDPNDINTNLLLQSAVRFNGVSSCHNKLARISDIVYM